MTLSRTFATAFTATAAALALGVAGAGAAYAEGVSTRVEFAPGTSGTVIDGTVIHGETDSYYLEARGGQSLSVTLFAFEGDAVFSITGPDRVTTSNSGVSTSMPLPYDGVYSVDVTAVNGHSSYSLNIDIY